MRKNVFKISILFVFCGLFVAFGLRGTRVKAYSAGPDAARTGAPGELTCSMSGCHLGSAVNGGGGTLIITGVPANYSPNQDVDITVTINQTGRVRFGFEATVIDDTGKAAGTLSLTNTSRTQSFQGVAGGNLRRYISHTFNGTTATSSGQNVWTFHWKAPAQSVGRITFYAAGNAANNDGSETGDLIYTTNASTQPAAAVANVTTVSAASFAQGVSLAPEVIVAGFGTGLSQNVAIASTNPLPTQLDGSEVHVKDSTNTDRLAGLFFVAPSQINYIIPAGTATGAATISVVRGTATVAQGTVQIESTSPGIFTANASGTGVPAALALRVVGATQTFESIYSTQTGQPVATPINLGPVGNDVYLILYGTGIRNAAAATVTATIGGTATPILGFAAAPGFVGLDQVNVGPIPRSLITRGTVDVVLTVGTKTANTVTINIQ